MLGADPKRLIGIAVVHPRGTAAPSIDRLTPKDSLAAVLACKLRRAGYAIFQPDDTTIAIGKQLKHANRANVCGMILIGDDELATNQVTIKDFTSGEQSCVPIASLEEELLGRFPTSKLF